jgi:hypothetical protein
MSVFFQILHIDSKMGKNDLKQFGRIFQNNSFLIDRQFEFDIIGRCHSILSKIITPAGNLN